MTDNRMKELLSSIETLELTDSERSKADGSFIELPCGNTHYELKGDGESVVLVHGYATPYFIYDKIFDSLIEAGYKVLRYDLLGRGLSERVEGPYTPELFSKQLDELTKALLGDEKFYLFGTSMGGTITTTFCKNNPGRVKKLVLLAPAGMDSFKPPFYMTLCSIPGLGGAFFNAIGGKTLLKRCTSELIYSDEKTKDYYTESFASTIRYKGFVRCTHSSLVNTILDTKTDMDGFRYVAKENIPMLVIWGTNDKTMPYYQHERLLETCPDAKLVTFEGSGHIFLFDEGERTMNEVLPFLRSQTD